MDFYAGEGIAAVAGTMEITVKVFELLRELTATQGVVERKTTIPILSNYLFESRATACRSPLLTLILASALVQCQGKKRRILHHPLPASFMTT